MQLECSSLGLAFQSFEGRVGGRIARDNAALRRLTVCGARGKTPYEPLERAVQVINRVITVAERAGWGSGSGKQNSSCGPQPDRWVQFGAATSAQLAVEEVGAPGAAATQPIGGASTPPAGTISLRQYLCLPVEEYSLLDPKWIQRQDGGTFKLTIPLAELLGMDLTPEITVAVQVDQESGKVTLVGTRAALGRDEWDAAFRLNMVAVLTQAGGMGSEAAEVQRQPSAAGSDGSGSSGGGAEDGRSAGAPGPLSRLRRPKHLPGRPVQRLRKLVARARGRGWHPTADDEWESPAAVSLPSWSEVEWGGAAPSPPAPPVRSSSSSSSSGGDGSRRSSGSASQPLVAPHDVAGPSSAMGTELAMATATSAPAGAPLEAPQQRSSQPSAASSEAATGSSQGAPEGCRERGPGTASAVPYIAPGGAEAGVSNGANSSSSREFDAMRGGNPVYLASDDSDEDYYGAHAVPAEPAQQAVKAAAAKAAVAGIDPGATQLGCRVSVRVALRVPRAARAVPNALLGYAGRVLLKAVLAAVLPNFMELLATDYRRWAGAQGGEGAPGGMERDLDGALGELFVEAPAPAPQDAGAQAQ